MSWYCYMVRCSDNTFYTGVATDIARRIAEHNSRDKAAKYTRARQPVELVYSEQCADRSTACAREWQIKQLPRQAKQALVDKG